MEEFMDCIVYGPFCGPRDQQMACKLWSIKTKGAQRQGKRLQWEYQHPLKMGKVAPTKRNDDGSDNDADGSAPTKHPSTKWNNDEDGERGKEGGDGDSATTKSMATSDGNSNDWWRGEVTGDFSRPCPFLSVDDGKAGPVMGR